MNPLRFGILTYLNCLPATLGLEQGAVGGEDWVFKRGTPAELNAMMRKGELDVSLVSAAEYLDNEQLYTRLPEVSQWCEGIVESVCLYSVCERSELESMSEPLIGVTPESASSVALTQLLLPSSRTEPFQTEESAEAGLRSGRYKAVLLIGDKALQPPSWTNELHCHDLCEWWSKERGLPMTFAVWVARKGIEPERLAAAHDVLQRSLKWGTENWDTVLSTGVDRSSLDRSRLNNYLKRLRFHTTDRSESGFREYRTLLMRRRVVGTKRELTGVANAL